MIEKRNFDPQKLNIDQNTKIRPHKNISLYDGQFRVACINSTIKQGLIIFCK